MSEIIIENVKNIKKMTFKMPSKKGVFLLVGNNGAGKTSLLTCIHRIGAYWAFRSGFVNHDNNSGYDSYKNSRITYKLSNGDFITYKNKNKNWTASPRNMVNNVKSGFGFANVTFIKSIKQRFDYSEQNIGAKKNSSVLADKDIRTSLCNIFANDKFEELKILKSSSGVQGKMNKMYTIKKYTEKQFSTGELAMIRMMEVIKTINAGDLLLIDETELALHPRAQKNLIEYLKKISKEKEFTIILSSHSSCIVNAVNSENIYLLQDANGLVDIINPCFQLKALNSVDIHPDVPADKIMFVEDEMAKCFLNKAVLNIKYKHIKFQTIAIAIFPVGGYNETIKLARKVKDQFYGEKVKAFVDNDVQRDINNNASVAESLQSYINDYIILPVIPEVALIMFIEENISIVNIDIKDKFKFDLMDLCRCDHYKNMYNANSSKLAKNKFKEIVEAIANKSGESHEKIIDYIFTKYVNYTFEESIFQEFNGKLIAYLGR